MNQANHKEKVMELYSLLAVDLISIIVSYILAVLLRFGTLSNLAKSDLHVTVCLCCMLFCTVFSLLIDWNRGFLKRGYFVELTTVLKYIVIMVVGVASMLFLLQQGENFSRLVFGFFFLFNFMLTYAAHVCVKKLLRNYMKSERNRIPIMLILESGDMAETVESILMGAAMNYEVTAIAVLDEDRQGEVYRGIPIQAGRDNLMEVARQIPLDEVFIRLPKEPSKSVRGIIKDFESMGIICHYSLNVVEWNDKESIVEKFCDYTVITYSIYNIDYSRRMVKRLMDITGGLVGLVITAILTPFIALAVKLDSRGPVLFSQIRIGKNGRRFKIYKFRSMYLDAEQRKKELQKHNEVKGLMFKMKDDPRITRVGKFLRKTSLDELPQFYNVLTGEMSLVGTRPPTEDEFGQYSLYYRRRLCMTPGLTGLWQVSGRSSIENFDDVVKYDLEYIDNWSLSVDIKILMQTIWVVIAGRGSK